MSNLLSFKFWFLMNPGSLLPVYQNILIGIIAVLIVGSIVFNILGKKNKNNLYNPIWKRLFTFSVVNAIIGVVLLFFTYEEVRLLSSRFWFILWGVGILIWKYFIYRKIMSIPKRREEMAKELEYKKYIP